MTHNQFTRWRGAALLMVALALGLLGGFFLGRAAVPAAPQPEPSATETEPDAPDTPTPRPTRTPTTTPVSVEALPEVDVDALIHIHTPADIEAKRRDLLDFIYGQPELSDDVPVVIENAPLTMPGVDLSALDRFKADLLRVDVPEGFTSTNFLLHARASNNQLVIYHLGHQAAPSLVDVNNFRNYLKAGYDLVIMNMPLYGPNADLPVVDTDCCGPISMVDHEMLVWADRPIRPFILPVNEVVNYAVKQDYATIYMTGISGGGWTTMVYGALDPRLKGIAPMAGSQPLWFYRRDQGVSYVDFEQRLPGLYRLAGYEDLYVMGAYGNGRDRWSLFGFNLYDSCCFRGTTYEAYEAAVQNRIAALGAGEFSVVMDPNQHGHEYGKPLLDAALARMKKDGK